MGVGVASVVLVVALAAVSCACYRRRGGPKGPQASQRRHPDKNLPLKKSSAVRSPSSGPAGPILKKSPSPTGGGAGVGGGSKSPLGGHRSPSSHGEYT